ncbi:TetR/AcrR family transcriptional regulator [Microvirga lenta]|uniref:TetR/AcrR family transcriptional regulator n=1 Tax=Microvirga lenta TaxID=2881337 RepID=UPI001CFFDB9C|nr:TetR/AcrR family transcriptional regulator [Microvirga lenta]MCB5175866.1 TetR/AcrR family transcriptional regulator [Microvirga lenta]
MTAEPRKRGRAQAVRDLKRSLILEAARTIFETEGLDGASLRAIAAEAGYTPAALYFHFESKEAIYAEVLQASLNNLREAVATAVANTNGPAPRLRAAAMAFFKYYADNPRDLDLGFYLFRGGMKPKGLGRERDEQLNAGLAAALLPIAEAARAMGASQEEADLMMVDTFAHAAGMLLLAHTGRIRMFGTSAPGLMERYIDERIGQLERLVGAQAAAPALSFLKSND